MVDLALKLLGVLFGVLARTLSPYLRKVKAGKIKKFEKGYWLSAGAASILGVITTLLIFPEFELARTEAGIEASIRLFFLAFGFGFGWNSLVAEGAKWGERRKS